MPTKDPSHERRISDLEARLRDTERELRAVRQVASTPLAPIERWLGRTTSESVSDYPEDGDTFAVELLSCHFTPTAGTQAVTSVQRGSQVVARTWPAQYLPRGTEIEAWRSRGMGPLGSGEWWITVGHGDGAAQRCVITGSGGYAWREGETGFAANPIIGSDGGVDVDKKVKLFPPMAGNVENDDGQAFSVNDGPAAYDDHWLTLTQDGRYRVIAAMQWQLDNPSYPDTLTRLAAAGEPTAMGLVHYLVAVTAQIAVDLGEATESLVSGSSTLPILHMYSPWPYVAQLTLIAHVARDGVDRTVDLLWSRPDHPYTTWLRARHSATLVTVEQTGPLQPAYPP